MKSPAVVDDLRFEATLVAAQESKHGGDCTLHGIYFGEGDPEMGGQHWNFTRTLGVEDEGVCTVKEIQEVTVYGGIAKFLLTRGSVLCGFDESTAKETGVRRLRISFQVDESRWAQLAEQARRVFTDQAYFTVSSNAG